MSKATQSISTPRPQCRCRGWSSPLGLVSFHLRTKSMGYLASLFSHFALKSGPFLVVRSPVALMQLIFRFAVISDYDPFKNAATVYLSHAHFGLSNRATPMIINPFRQVRSHAMQQFVLAIIHLFIEATIASPKQPITVGDSSVPALCKRNNMGLQLPRSGWHQQVGSASFSSIPCVCSGQAQAVP